MISSLTNKSKSRTKFKSRTKSKKHINNKPTQICELSKTLLKQNTTHTHYIKYENYIKSIVNSFTTSKNILLLLTDIFKSKNTINFTITCNEQHLDEYTRIPPFIEIFKFLITKEEFINKFSLNEQKQLHLFIDNNNNKHKSSHASSHASSHISKITTFYNFISKSNIGKKLSSLYYSLDNSIKSELTLKYPSILFHNLLINSYTSFEIIEDLEINIKQLYTFSIKWKGKQLDNLLYLFMYKNTSSNISNLKYINKIGNEIIKRILFFNEFLGVDKLPSKFIIFLTDNKKEIDEELLSQIHFKTLNINTAVTNGTDVIIYRKEELLKSIFHELIHFHNLDFRHIPETLLNYLKQTHNIKDDNEYTLFECVTESLANILNNIFLSSDIEEFTNNLVNELMFSTTQVAKILSICNYKSWNEFAILDSSDSSDNNKHKHKHKHIYKHNIKKQFKQDSCVFSYYILKFYILLNLEHYFNNCLDTKLKFIQTEKSFKSLITLFDISRNNLYLKDIINNILHSMSNSVSKHKKYNKTDKIRKTLRMTCIESNIV